MSYLEEFKSLLEARNVPKLLSLWEEYCANDRVDEEEFIDLLKMIKSSDQANMFGQYMETGLSLWQFIKNEKNFKEAIRLIVDIQSTNSPVFADAAYQILEKYYGQQPEFSERLRLVGLRTRDRFQGAISKYELLDHMKKGKFVFHTAGWGTGEILEISPLREQLTVEFENMPALRHLTFSNALNTLIPLSDDHFLARRFGNPDALEREGRQDPVGLIQLLLRDLGPKSASEIKDELCELVIPEEDWTRWWQNARSKLKKHSLIETPESQKDSFILRKEEFTHGDRFDAAIHDEMEMEQRLQTLYQLVRDHPHMLKDPELKSSIMKNAQEILNHDEATTEIKLQTHLFLNYMLEDKEAGNKAEELIADSDDIVSLIQKLDIAAMKKRAMMIVHHCRTDWVEIFLQLLSNITHSQLRDYLLLELNKSDDSKERLIINLQHLLNKPAVNAEFFVWYFQKILTKEKKDLPFSHKEGICTFFEAFLILYNEIELNDNYKDLVKKMNTMIIAKRYAMVRAILEGTSLEYAKEFLLLVSKCHTLTENDKSILRSLAEVVHPELSDKRKHAVKPVDGHVIWTTEEGYVKVRNRINEIGTKEMLETAREIEKARSYGDLRENSEYKYALEKRARLQSELKMLSEQLNRARIFTVADMTPEEVCFGSVVKIQDPSGQLITYTILGPWDADPDSHILSFQSKLAQAMTGSRKGDTFLFKDEEYKIVDISNRYASV